MFRDELQKTQKFDDFRDWLPRKTTNVTSRKFEWKESQSEKSSNTVSPKEKLPTKKPERYFGRDNTNDNETQRKKLHLNLMSELKNTFKNSSHGLEKERSKWYL